MTVEISTLGSCSSRNIFNSILNENYKDFFHINKSIEAVTFISLMSEPLNFDQKLLDSSDSYDNECVLQDFSKKYLTFLKTAKIEYLIIDTYFDAIYEIIINDKNSYISDSERLKRTSLHSLFNDKKRISITNNFEEFYDLWTHSVESFFKFISTNCPNIKIILNCSRSVYRYYDDGKIIEDENLKKISYLNKYRDILDRFILANFDVEVLEFDDDTLAYKDHIFGLHSTHYEPKYYEYKTLQLNEIIARNNTFDYSYRYNAEIRTLKKKNMLCSFSHKNQQNSIPDLFKKYLTARIDLKNEKSHNAIEILENSDENATILHPDWFEDELGSGIIIQSQQRKVNLKIKCIHDGELTLRFRGKDVRDKDGVRIPVYINYGDIFINNEKINDNVELVCHDKPYIYKRKVKHHEILTISIEWSPF